MDLCHSYGALVHIICIVTEILKKSLDAFEQELYLLKLLSSIKVIFLMNSSGIPENVGVKE